MNGPPQTPDPKPQTPSRPWSTRKLAAIIFLATIGQFALIHWFSSRTPTAPRTAVARPVVQFAANTPSELFALTDPTIFSRAHPGGFSGRAWLAVPEQNYQPAETDATPATLELAPETLGATFRAYRLTNDSGRWTARYLTTPAPTEPAAGPVFNTPATSRLNIKGPLASLPLRFTPPLSVWTNTDILAPSEVLLDVDARGNPVSATLVQPRSGYKPGEHDRRAVELAMQTTFRTDNSATAAPAGNPEAGLISGRLIFLWHTVAPGTNGILNPR